MVVNPQSSTHLVRGLKNPRREEGGGTTNMVVEFHFGLEKFANVATPCGKLAVDSKIFRFGVVEILSVN